jgi:hypothetical protein
MRPNEIDLNKGGNKMTKLVPDEFEVPLELNLPAFILRPLTVEHLEIDYEAVMSSKTRLRQVFCVDDYWPSDQMTLEEDRRDLIWHEDEFERRSSFAYTVLSPSGSRCLGCVYFFSTQVADYDAEVYFWVRDDEFLNGLDSILYKAVNKWLKTSWPFRNPAFPGRDIPWKDWSGKRIQGPIP